MFRSLSFFCIQPKAQYPFPPSFGILAYFLGSTIGCRLACAKASIADDELPSVRITVPIDMKKLSRRIAISTELDSEGCARQREMQAPETTYPNVSPEPSMYCPKVLIGPLGPAPYLMILKPPSVCFSTCQMFGKVLFVKDVPKMKPMISPTAVEQSSGSVKDLT